ncbi:MAG: alpha/beta hydrolase [Bacteroidales bacterium]|nr:alpha/beta hydrolase [Bacteroidales bacterium]
MKMSCLTTAIAVSLLFCLNGVHAQTTLTQPRQVCLNNTEQFSVASKYVEGETYVIQVGLPIEYSASTKSYPVFYITDGDISFGMIKGIADLLMRGKEIQDIIVVGISYNKGLTYMGEKRGRDLVPGSDTIFAEGENASGADNFIKFIQYELFPVINKNYRTNPDSSAIGGHSLGGLLNSYILFKQPELFNKYVIGSPTVNARNKITFKLETEYFNRHKELNRTVYVYYGSLEHKDYTNPIDEFIQNIQIHKYKGLRLVARIFEGETHMSVPSGAITNGLKTIFKP